MPMPAFSDDDVLDFMVVEALMQRGRKTAQDAEKQRERDDFMKSHSGFDPANSPPPGG